MHLHLYLAPREYKYRQRVARHSARVTGVNAIKLARLPVIVLTCDVAMVICPAIWKTVSIVIYPATPIPGRRWRFIFLARARITIYINVDHPRRRRAVAQIVGYGSREPSSLDAATGRGPSHA